MPPEAEGTPRGRLRTVLRGARDLLVLETRLLTGNRVIVLVLIELGIFAILAAIALLGDEPWSPEALYQVSVWPALVPAITLGMSAIMGERDTRQLEVTFASPGGRWLAWSFRLTALVLTCLASSVLMSVLSWAVIDRDFAWVAAALHAAVPLAFAATLTTCLSVAFAGTASAGLGTSVVLGLGWMMVHAPDNWPRVDPFLNPFVPPENLLDPAEWFRIVVFNRSFYLIATGLLAALTLRLLQSRERLL